MVYVAPLLYLPFVEKLKKGKFIYFVTGEVLLLP